MYIYYMYVDRFKNAKKIHIQIFLKYFIIELGGGISCYRALNICHVHIRRCICKTDILSTYIYNTNVRIFLYIEASMCASFHTECIDTI